MSVDVATILVAGALVFAYNYAMAGKNQDASKSNTHNGVQIGGPKDKGNVGNTGNNFVGNPIPGVDCSTPLHPRC